MSKPLRLGVIGAGRIGRVHAHNAAFRCRGAELAAVYDPDASAAEACVRRCRAGVALTHAARVIEDPAIDAVLICSPTGLHAEQIEACAAAGKAIFCEKPIALELERIDTALAAVRRAGVPLMVGFNRRFDPGFARARQVVAEGGIGAPQLVRITSRDPAPPSADYVRASGGLFLDMTIHDLDMARWVVGQEVQRVSALGANLIDPAIGAAGDIDTAVITLSYAGGALGCIDNSRKAIYGYDQRLEVFGSEGCVRVDNVPSTTAVVSDAAGVTADPPLHFFVERYEAAYVAELQAFVDALRAGDAPPVGGEEARLPVLMALAADRSRREGRAVEV